MEPKLELSGLIGGINPLYKCFAWSGVIKNTYFYACANNIIVSNVDTTGNSLSLSGHSDRVNFVKALNKFSDRQLLVSGGSDSKLIIWEGKSESISSVESWKEKFRFDLTHSVLFASTIEFPNNIAYVVAGNIMGKIFLIRVADGSDEKSDCQILDSITFGHHFTQECSAILNLNRDNDVPSQLVIALGGLDFNVHIYYSDLQKYENDSNKLPGSLFDFKASLKGHEDAITDLQVLNEVTKESRSEWLIASSSKDSYIRLWRLAELHNDEGVKQISDFQNKQTQRISLGDKKCFVQLESVLNGHNDSVVCLDWGYHQGKPALLSASFDFSIILWIQDSETGIWLSAQRLGQVTGNKFAFFQAGFSSDSQKILSYTFTGSSYLWAWNPEKLLWETRSSVSGHSKHVFDLDWSSKGDFLVSCGLDQTTRIFAYSNYSLNWHEISRAQVHGYDINSVKLCPVNLEGKNICDTLLCGADEKVVRLFEPPAAFINSVNLMTDNSIRLFFEDEAQEKKYLNQKQLENGIFEYEVSSEGGAQVLGLMTKAVKLEPAFDPSKYVDPEDEGALLISDKFQNKEDKRKEEEYFSQKHNFSAPPTEDYLIKHTLWPELNKLYGHGYEIKCVGCSHDGQLIASCAKSQTKENAKVIFWNPKNYQIYNQIEYHNFTINQFEFSKSDLYFATVSKDRSLAVFQQNKTAEGALNTSNPYSLVYVDKSHTRLVQAVAFSHDEKYVASGARDKRIKIHLLGERKVVLSKVLSSTITALAFFPTVTSDLYSIVVGFEEGAIEIYSFNPESNTITLLAVPLKFNGHSDAITRIKFRPPNKQTTTLQFASCSLDHTVRVFNLK